MIRQLAGWSRRSLSREVVAVTLGYLGVSLVVLWNVWSSGPSTTTMCACGDSARYLWFISWPAWALRHGHGFFWSTRLFPPTGFNLLDDTSVLAFGVPLIPLTLLFGPVLSLNVALTLAPTVSAAAMYVLLRRWVQWRPAAFVGGLAYGFSLWMLTGITNSWLNFSIAIPPLLVACVDELVVTRRYRPSRVGVVMGLLVVVQFFVSTELLVITMLLIGAALVALGVLAVLRRWSGRVVSWRSPVLGIATAGGVTAVLLAYPTWFALAGPSHLTGLVWPTITPGWYGITPSSFVSTTIAGGGAIAHRAGGYQGQPLASVASLGWPMLLVLILGLVVLRRHARVWLLAGVGVLASWASLSSDRDLVHFPVPFDVLAHLPVIDNVLPIRFVAGVTFCTCAVVALAADQVHTSIARCGGETATIRGRSLLGTIAGSLVLVVAFSSLAVDVVRAVPLTSQPATAPRWFVLHGRHLSARDVVLTYPAPFSGIQAPLAWQASDHLTYAVAGGDGPRSALRRAGRARRGEAVFADLTFSTPARRDLSATSEAALATAIRFWVVTLIVIPDPRTLPVYDTGANTAAAAALVAGTLGRAPRFEDDAWVWRVPRHFISRGTSGTWGCVDRHQGDPGAAARCSAAS